MLPEIITNTLRELSGKLPQVPELPAWWDSPRVEGVKLIDFGNPQEKIILPDDPEAIIKGQIADILSRCRTVLEAAEGILGDEQKNEGAVNDVPRDTVKYWVDPGYHDVLHYALHGGPTTNSRGRNIASGWFVGKGKDYRTDIVVGEFLFENPGTGINLGGKPSPEKPTVNNTMWLPTVELYTDGVKITLPRTSDSVMLFEAQRKAQGVRSTTWKPEILLMKGGTLRVRQTVYGPCSDALCDDSQLEAGFIMRPDGTCFIGVRYLPNSWPIQEGTTWEDVIEGATKLNPIPANGGGSHPYTIKGKMLKNPLEEPRSAA